MSNYNYGLEPGIRRSGTSRVRFVLIFLVISALTAALLWWFWPGKEEVVPEKKSSGTPVADVETKQLKPSVAEPGVSGGISVTPAAPKENPKKNVAPAVAPAEPAKIDPTDPPLPEKGVVTAADKKGADLPVVPADTPLSEIQQKKLQQAKNMLAAEDYAGAEKAAGEALKGVVENSAFYRQVWRVLTDARMGMVFKGTKNPYVITYKIRGGDNLNLIAGKFFTTVELLRKKNNISGSRIFVGKQLYVVPGDWRVVVSKKYRLLKLYRKAGGNESVFAVWEVGLGRNDKTPAAEFAVAARMRHPDWYLPDGRVFKYGEPENQLGEYFLKLAPASAPGRPLLGYGIHGAKDETTVGRSLSSGCVRMRNVDVESLYYLVPSGCRVSVVEE